MTGSSSKEAAGEGSVCRGSQGDARELRSRSWIRTVGSTSRSMTKPMRKPRWPVRAAGLLEAKGDPADAKKKAAGKIKAAAKEHGIDIDANPKSLKPPEERCAGRFGWDWHTGGDGHLDSGRSGLVGPVVTGVKTPPSDNALLTWAANDCVEIPDEMKV